MDDPATNESARFRRAVLWAAGAVAALWAIQVARTLGLDLSGLGVQPGTLRGLLPGVVVAPLLHGGFGHLIANSMPLVVLISAVLYVYPSVAVRVLVLSALLPGLAVWALARGSAFHIGASGVVYSLAVFVFVSGLLRRDNRSMAVALMAYFLYGGSVLWGVLPTKAGVSWETHLAGAITGLLLAVIRRRQDRVPAKRYDWEAESGDDDDDDPRFTDTSV